MIKNIIEILSIDPFFNASKEVQVAKGINTLPKNFKEGREQLKRLNKFNKKR